MLVMDNDLTMKTVWTPIEKVEETGDLLEKESEELKTWVIENKVLYEQNEQGYNRVNAKAYILGKDTPVKEGDKLDGVFVRRLIIVNDLDGKTDHVECYTY